MGGGALGAEKTLMTPLMTSDTHNGIGHLYLAVLAHLPCKPMTNIVEFFLHDNQSACLTKERGTRMNTNYFKQLRQIKDHHEEIKRAFASYKQRQ